MVHKLGPKTGNRVKEGQRVVAVPWPTAGGEGTYQQYVATPEKDLVTLLCTCFCMYQSDCICWFPVVNDSFLQVVVPDNVDDDMAAQFLVIFSCLHYLQHLFNKL